MLLNDHNIRWGILGPGSIARSFAEDLRNMAGAELYAVASRSPLKADEFKAEFNAKKAYGNYLNMVKDPDVDAVYIATPHACHYENTLLCLDHGKAVLCEKPMAMNSHEAEVMFTMAEMKNTLLMEALWTCFLPHYDYVMRLLKQNTFGKLLRVEADFGAHPEFDPESRLFNKALGGGSLLDIGIYPVFTALSTLGVPDDIKARAGFFSTGADSDCTMEFYYDNGASAFLKSTLTEVTPTTATFFCEKGRIRINEKFFKPSSVSLITDKGEETINFDVNCKGYRYEIAHFNRLLRQGATESPLMSFKLSRNIAKTLDRVRNEIGLAYEIEY